jgi:hypothetical protein
MVPYQENLGNRENGMTRKKLWQEDMQSRFPEGTFAMIKTLLKKGEKRTDFVRAAVQREIEYRRAEKKLARAAK